MCKAERRTRSVVAVRCGEHSPTILSNNGKVTIRSEILAAVAVIFEKEIVDVVKNCIVSGRRYLARLLRKETKVTMSSSASMSLLHPIHNAFGESGESTQASFRVTPSRYQYRSTRRSTSPCSFTSVISERRNSSLQRLERSRSESALKPWCDTEMGGKNWSSFVRDLPTASSQSSAMCDVSTNASPVRTSQRSDTSRRELLDDEEDAFPSRCEFVLLALASLLNSSSIGLGESWLGGCWLSSPNPTISSREGE